MSTWVNELTSCIGESCKGDIDGNSRYEYCFGYNYQYFIVYDKEKRYVINAKILSYSEYNNIGILYNIK